jgi:hypothetical protein
VEGNQGMKLALLTIEMLKYLCKPSSTAVVIVHGDVAKVRTKPIGNWNKKDQYLQ